MLLVDEAHHLPLRLLDEIRSLTNLTRDMQPAVRMVLAGSHVLEERFASPKLESFSQRISVRCYLEAFQRSETQAYIQSRLSAGGGQGSEIFPAETCQMVHQATDGVPRLINQVCDHVLLLAYAAGIRRIEPAHVEEAWADLQQLPTPWNAPATASGDGMIEFGGLDDNPLEATPIAGKIAAAEETGAAEDASPGEQTDPARAPARSPRWSPRRKTRRASNSSATSRSCWPTCRLNSSRRRRWDRRSSWCSKAPHPFAEPFEEEEVIADRYAVAAPPSAASPSADHDHDRDDDRMAPDLPCGPAASRKFKSNKAERDEYAVANEAGPACAGESREESEVAAVAVAAVDEGPPPRPTRAVVPPPRQEFGRLFAKLRRGL